ncbi:hypothetical protein [Nocardia tenerifensis]|uniref:hypothetical protein n=1 Tax=Nocardia tenerifensis TaxID=228006 RepID=UPI0002F60A28|nr:hypothetical protein [Nocardia tenerifensis]
MPTCRSRDDGGFLGILIGTTADGDVIVEAVGFIRDTASSTSPDYQFSWYT